MKKMFTGLIMLLSSFNLLAAEAGDNYVGGGISRGILELKNVDEASASPSALKLEAGHYFLPFLALQGQVLYGIDMADEAKIKLVAAVHLKGQLDLGSRFNLYALAGEAYGLYEVDGVSIEDGNVTVGVGAAFKPVDNFEFKLEVITYSDNNEATYSGVNLGFSILL